VTLGTSEDDIVQILTPAGERITNPDFAYSGSDADVASYLRDMVLARRFDTEGTALQRKGELGLWCSLLGQEAAQAGSAAAIGPLDFVFPSYREHAVALKMGVDPLELLAPFRGTSMIDWDSAALRFHLYSFVIGSQTLHAVGYAMGMQRDGVVGNPDPADNGATIVYFGDGATSQGDVNEAFVFAASYQAPVVFFCQNNQWAISEPITRQSRIPLYRRADGFGFPGVRVDGNDPLAVHAVTSWALDRARSGRGPTLIEAFTYRMGAHTTSDDPTKYRQEDELAKWRAKDPIERTKAYLLSQGAIDQDFLGDLQSDSDALAERMRTGCLTLPRPDLADMWTRTFASTPQYLEAQQAAYVAYADSFLDTAEAAS
jgi:pyruvate dehydrogenase E1 component alpha subunit